MKNIFFPQKKETATDSSPISEGLHAWLYATFWTIVIIISLSWNIAQQKREIIEVATNEAKTIFAKDFAYYRWATGHHGVYVPVTDKTPPNPNLKNLPEATGITATGVPLTLVNPEYMIRQVYETKAGLSSALGHITSLDPIRKENMADSWESLALDSFEDDQITETSSVENIKGRPYLRLMRPLFTETDCLKCHAQQGYELGDIRGGISVSVPMSLLFSIYKKEIIMFTLAHGFLWILGLMGIYFSSRRINQSMRKRAQAEAKTRSIINNMLDGLITMSEDGSIESLNSAACQMFGCDIDDTLGKNIAMFIQFPNDAQPEDSAIASTSLNISSVMGSPMELIGLRKDDTSFPLEISLSDMPLGESRLFIARFRDITEEKIRKAEALRTGQLAAIGELAAGVAHEINNPINGIINYAQILLDDTDGDEAGHDIMTRIIKEGERIAVIVSNLLSFARQRDDAVEELSIKKIIEDSVTLLVYQLQKGGIHLSMDIQDDLPFLLGNPQHLQQVVINLLTNAFYALNQRYPVPDDQKRIEIICRLESEHGLEFIRTTISDWGIGIEQNDIDHIFESLFTTKPTGQGTGLGLSISKGLVREHKGRLSVTSKPNGPTVATIDLPVGDADFCLWV